MTRAYIPMTTADRDEMLSTVGAASIDELFRDVPAFAQTEGLPGVPTSLSEQELVHDLQQLAGENVPAGGLAFFRGGGAYRRFTPAVVDEIIRRGEFLTSYTPYQPEASQGTLQAAFEFQSMVCALYGMDVANAGLYDGASALAEACLMACRVTGRSQILLADGINPRYREVIETYALPQGLSVDIASESEPLLSPEHACLVVQSPDYYGRIVLVDDVPATLCHANGSLLVVSADPMSLGLLRPPGELGADIAIGEGQSLGLPLSFGGPYVGLFAARSEFVRQMPGRLVGQTLDVDGRRAYVLTLQAREQHIRRERASSNVCTSEQLIALAVTVYLSSMGREGLAQAARACYDKAHYAAQAISQLPGWRLAYPGAPFFSEFVVECRHPFVNVNRFLRWRRIIGGLDVSNEDGPRMLLCVTETNTREEIDRLVRELGVMN